VRRQVYEGKRSHCKLVFGFKAGPHRAYMIEFSVPNARPGFLNRAAPKSMNCLMNIWTYYVSNACTPTWRQPHSFYYLAVNTVVYFPELELFC
jgi:hypothetical protein